MNYTISEESFDSLDSYWNNPSQHLKWGSVFVLPSWLRVWWHVFRSRADLCLFSVKNQAGVIGIAPLKREGSRVSFIGSADVCDYLDFIVLPGEESIFFEAVLDHLGQNGVSEMDLRSLRPDSTVITSLIGAAQKRGHKVVYSQEDVSLETELPSTWEQYLRGLSRKQSHELERKLRRLSEAGEIEYRCQEVKQVDPVMMNTFLKLFVQSRQDKAEFMTAQMESFFRATAAAMAEIGLLRFGTLEIARKTVAMIMGFDFDNAYCLYNSGYDPEFSSLSVGILLKALCIKESIEAGKSKFDFLKGDEDYKYHLGGKEVPVYRCQVALR